MITLGDFNTACNGGEVGQFLNQTGSDLIYGDGIDCVAARGLSGNGYTFNASPSDHPGIAAQLELN